MLRRTLIAFYFLLLAASLVACNLHLFDTLLFNDTIPGWDGQTHYAIGKIYAEHIFPSTWGWIDEWYLGMPFPQFYPPAFFFFVALASKLFFFASYAAVFKWFIFLSLIATPILISLFAFKLSQNKFTSGLAGIITVLLMSFHGADANIGISVSATINTGLFSHSLGFNFFVLWLINLFSAEPFTRTETFKNKFFGVILLALIFLSSVHLAVPAFIFFIGVYLYRIYTIYKPNQNYFKTHLLSFFRYHVLPVTWDHIVYGASAIGLAAFWILPMVSRYDYFLTTTLNAPNNILLYFLIVLCYLPFLYGIIFIVRPGTNIKVLSTIMVSLAALIIINIFISLSVPLPVHVIRWLPPILYLSAIPMADFFTFLYEHMHGKRGKILTGVFIITFLGAATYAQIFVVRDDSGLYKDFKKDNYPAIAEFLKNDAGLTLIENNTKDNTPVSFVLDAYLGEQGVPTVFSNLRESSMTGLYTVPLRNLFSEQPEMWGVQSFLAVDNQFIGSTTLPTKIALAKYFGIKNIIATQASTTERLTKAGIPQVFNSQPLKPAPSDKSLGQNFSIFNIKPNAKQMQLTVPITAVFADVQLKDRTEAQVTFSRLSEEWMKYFNPNIVLVRPNSMIIDNNPIFDIAKVAVLNTYTYKNNAVAEVTLKKFVERGGTIVDVSAGDVTAPEVYKNISNLYKKNIKSWKSERQATSTVTTLIKQSYFPDWKVKNSTGDVYLASPSFILVTSPTGTDIQKLELVFTTNHWVSIGYGISLFSLLCLVLYSTSKTRRFLLL